MLGLELKKQLDSDELVDNLIASWKFYLPKIDLVKRILLLNERIGDEYFQREYYKVLDKEDDLKDHKKQFEENLKDIGWHKWLFNQISQVIFHDENDKPSMSDEEFFSFSQRYISERIYNHLAMLSRSPHAEERGAFSLREELTEEFAENIGLGLYLTDKISAELRAETESVLYDLAESFEAWYMDEKHGCFSTIFGEVCASEELNKTFIGKSIILTPDVRQGKTFVAGQ